MLDTFEPVCLQQQIKFMTDCSSYSHEHFVSGSTFFDDAHSLLLCNQQISGPKLINYISSWMGWCSQGERATERLKLHTNIFKR